MSGICAGRVVAITGAGRGIGQQHALLFAKEGAKIVVNDVDKAEADKVVAEIKAMGGEAAEEADEGSSAREVAHPRPKESARKKAAATPGATGATRAGEGSSRRTPGLGTAQRMGSRDGPAEPTRSAVKQSKTPRAQHHTASTVIPEEPLEQIQEEPLEMS